MVLGGRLAVTSLEVLWSARLERRGRIEGKKRDVVGNEDTSDVLLMDWETYRMRDCPCWMRQSKDVWYLE
jgi:hypothetical protein